jgi:hypothetical protein
VAISRRPYCGRNTSSNHDEVSGEAGPDDLRHRVSWPELHRVCPGVREMAERLGSPFHPQRYPGSASHAARSGQDQAGNHNAWIRERSYDAVAHGSGPRAAAVSWSRRLLPRSGRRLRRGTRSTATCTTTGWRMGPRPSNTCSAAWSSEAATG